MPDQVIPITDLGKSGVVLDTPPVALPPNVFSNARNVRFNDGAVRKIPGEVDLPSTDIAASDTQGTLRYLAYWPNPNRAPLGGYYVYVQDVLSDSRITGQRVFIQDETGTRRDITPTNLTNGFTSVTSRSETSWSHTLFAGGFAFIINNGVNAPYYILDVEGNEDIADVPILARLPGWEDYRVNESIISATFEEATNTRDFDLGQLVDFTVNDVVVTVADGDPIVITTEDTAVSNVTPSTSTDTNTTILTFTAGALPDDSTVSVNIRSKQTVSVRAGVIRAFSDFLVAGNLTETVRARSQINGAVSIGATSIVLDDVSLFPDDGFVVIDGIEYTYSSRTTGTNTLGGFSAFTIAIADDTPVLLGEAPTVRRLTGVVRTSDVAVAGSVPANWDPFQAGVSTADEFTLSDTATVQDMAELQGNLYIYTNSSIHSMSLTGNTATPVRVNPVTDQYGVQSTNAVLEYDGKHFVIGSNDIYLFGGHPGNIQSVSDGRIRRYFYDNINPIHERALFTLLNQAFDEIWVCYPTLTSLAGESNEALIWNYRDNTWSIRDLNAVQGGAVAPIPGGGTPITRFTLLAPGGGGTVVFDDEITPALAQVAGAGAVAPSVNGDLILTFFDAFADPIIEGETQIEVRNANQGVFNDVYTVIIVEDLGGGPSRLTLQTTPPGRAAGENPPRGTPQYFRAGAAIAAELVSGEATSLNQGRNDAQNLTLPAGVEGINSGISTQFTLALSGDAVSFDAGDLSQVDVTFEANDEAESTDDQTPFGSGPNLRNAVNTISFENITVDANDEIQVTNIDNSIISLTHDDGVEAGGGRLTLNYSDTSVSPNGENVTIEIGDVFSGGNAVSVSNTGDQSDVGIAGVSVAISSSTRVDDVIREGTTDFSFSSINRESFDARLPGTGVTQQGVANDLDSVTDITLVTTGDAPVGLQKVGGVTSERSTEGSNVAIFRQVYSADQAGGPGNFTITATAHPGTGTWDVAIAGAGVNGGILTTVAPDPDNPTQVSSTITAAEFSFDLSTSETINQRSISVTNNSNTTITNAAIASGERGGFASDSSLLVGETFTLAAYDSSTAEASVPWTFSGNTGGEITTVTRTALLDNLASFINADGSVALADWQAVRDGTSLVLTSEVFGARTFSSASFTGFVGETTTITGDSDSNDLVFTSSGPDISVANNRTGLNADVVNLRITANVNQTGQVASDISLTDGVPVRDQLNTAFATTEVIWIPNMTDLIPAGDAVNNGDRGAGRPSSSAVTLATQFGDAIGGMSFSNWTDGSYLDIGGTQIPGVISGNQITFSVGDTVMATIVARTDDDVRGTAISTTARDSIGNIRIASAPNVVGTTTVTQTQTIASVASGQTETATFTSTGTVNSAVLTSYTGVISVVNAFADFNGSGNSLGTFNNIGGVGGLSVVVDTNHTYTEVVSIGGPGQPLDTSITVTRPDTGRSTSVNGVSRSQINTRYAGLLGGPNLTNVNSPNFYMTINQPFPEDGPRTSGLISGPGATHGVVVNNGRQTLRASNSQPTVNTTHVRNGITYRYMRWANAGNAYNRGNSGVYQVEIFINVANGASIVRVFGGGGVRPAFNIPNTVVAPQTRTGRRLVLTNGNPNPVVLASSTWGARTVAVGEARTVTRDSTSNSWFATGTYQAVAGSTTLRTFDDDNFVTTTLGNGLYNVSEADSPAVSLTVTQGTVSQTILLERNLVTMEELRQDIYDKLRSFPAFSGLDPTDASNTQPADAVYFLSLTENNTLRFQAVATGSNDPLTFTYSTIIGTTSYGENQFGGNITDTIAIAAGQTGDTPPIVRVLHERHGSADVILFGTNTSATVIDALGTTLANTGVWTYDSPTDVLTATTVPTEVNLAAENAVPTGTVISDPSNLLPSNFAFTPTNTRTGIVASNDTPTFMITSPEGESITYQIEGTGTLTAIAVARELATAIQAEDAFAGWLTEPPATTGTDPLIQFVDLTTRDRTPVTGTRIEYASVTGRWTVQLITAGNTGTNTSGNAMFPSTPVDSVTNSGGISQKFATPTSMLIRFSGLPAGENTRNIVIGTAGVRAVDQTITTPGAVTGLSNIAEIIRSAIRTDTVIGGRVTVGGLGATVTVEPNQFGEDAIYIESISSDDFIVGTNPADDGDPSTINTDRGYEPPRVPSPDGPDFGQAANFTYDRIDMTTGTNTIATRLDLLRPWASDQYNPNRLFPIFIQTQSAIQDDGSVTLNNRIRAADVGFTFGGTGYRSFVERATIGMTPEFDTEQLTSIALWADGGTQLEIGEAVRQATLRVSVRGTNSPGETTDLTVPDTDSSETNRKVINDFAVGEDYKVDTRIHGRFVNYRIDDQGSFNNVEWNLSGFQFDITKGGRR